MAGLRSASSWLALGAAVAIPACEYDFTVPSTGGAGGMRSTTSASTSASTSQASTTSASVASSSSGTVPDPLYAYKRAFPLVPAGWTKVPFSTEYGTDPNVPKDGIVAATKLQLQPVLMLLTSDGMVHQRVDDTWSTVALDVLFPPPPGGCKKDNDCMGAGEVGTCSNASAIGVTIMNHVPAISGCGDTSMNEGINLLGPTLVSAYVRAPSGAMSFLVQRDYKLDCYLDDYAMQTNFIWDVEIVDPTKGCMADNLFLESYARMTDGLLRYINAGTPKGTNSGEWTDTDPTNPLFPTPGQGEQPNPGLVVAAYFEQSPVPKAGTIVVIAP